MFASIRSAISSNPATARARRTPRALRHAANAPLPAELCTPLEPRQLMAADLNIALTDTFAPPSFMVPGDRVSIPLVIRNNGVEAFAGRTALTLRAFLLDGNGARAQNPAATFQRSAPASIAVDGSSNVSFDFEVDQSLPQGDYEFDVVLALRDAQNNSVADEFADDNTITLEDQRVNWVFGTFGGRSNIAFRGADADGTLYTLSISGPGFGFFVPAVTGGQNPTPGRIELGVPSQANPSNDSVSTFENVATAFNVAVVGRPGAANATVDLGANINVLFVDSIGRVRVPNLAAFNAPALNLTGSISFEQEDFNNVNLSRIGVSGAFTINNITGSLDVGRVGSFTASDLTLVANFNFFGPVGAFRVANIQRDVNASGDSLNFDDTVASVAAADVDSVNIDFERAVGAASFNNISTAEVTFRSSLPTFSARDIEDTIIALGAPLSTFSARNILATRITTNFSDSRTTRPLAFTAELVANTRLTALQVVSSLTVSKWELVGQSTSFAAAPAFGSVTVRPAPATNPPAGAGNFSATLYALGGTSRANAIDSFTVPGTFSGSVVAAGSVGSLTFGTFGKSAASVSAGASVFTSGALRSLTASSVRDSARVWANSIRSATFSVAANNTALEVLAGARFTPADVRDAAAATPNTDPSVFTRFRSGVVSNLAITIRPAITGFVGRFAAAVTPGDLTTDANGNLIFSGNANGAAADLLAFNAATVSRLERLSIVGDLSANANNSLDFAFLRLPTAAFSVGTPPVSISIPNPANPVTPARVTVANAPAALRFFRVGANT